MAARSRRSTLIASATGNSTGAWSITTTSPPNAVTVEQIAATAGISTRTFFRYFRNVRDILTAVPLRETEQICDNLRARPASEHLLEAFHAIFEQRESGPVLDDDARMQAEAFG